MTDVGTGAGQQLRRRALIAVDYRVAPDETDDVPFPAEEWQFRLKLAGMNVSTVEVMDDGPALPL